MELTNVNKDGDKCKWGGITHVECTFHIYGSIREATAVISNDGEIYLATYSTSNQGDLTVLKPCTVKYKDAYSGGTETEVQANTGDVITVPNYGICMLIEN